MRPAGIYKSQKTLDLRLTLDKTVCKKSVSFSVSTCFTVPFCIKASVRYICSHVNVKIHAVIKFWVELGMTLLVKWQLLNITCRSEHRL